MILFSIAPLEDINLRVVLTLAGSAYGWMEKRAGGVLLVMYGVKWRR